MHVSDEDIKAHLLSRDKQRGCNGQMSHVCTSEAKSRSVGQRSLVTPVISPKKQAQHT